VIKSRKIMGTERVAQMTNVRSGFKILVEKAARKLKAGKSRVVGIS
jgi:hypothetical protein